MIPNPKRSNKSASGLNFSKLCIPSLPRALTDVILRAPRIVPESKKTLVPAHGNSLQTGCRGRWLGWCRILDYLLQTMPRSKRMNTGNDCICARRAADITFGDYQ